MLLVALVVLKMTPDLKTDLIGYIDCDLVFEAGNSGNYILVFDSHNMSVHTLQLVRDECNHNNINIEIVVSLDSTFIFYES